MWGFFLTFQEADKDFKDTGARMAFNGGRLLQVCDVFPFLPHTTTRKQREREKERERERESNKDKTKTGRILFCSAFKK